MGLVTNKNFTYITAIRRYYNILIIVEHIFQLIKVSCTKNAMQGSFCYLKILKPKIVKLSEYIEILYVKMSRVTRNLA
jgi:hypothetical protein